MQRRGFCTVASPLEQPRVGYGALGDTGHGYAPAKWAAKGSYIRLVRLRPAVIRCANRTSGSARRRWHPAFHCTSKASTEPARSVKADRDNANPGGVADMLHRPRLFSLGRDSTVALPL